MVSKAVLIAGGLLIVLLGALTGFLLSRSARFGQTQGTSDQFVNTTTEFGSTSTAFKDTAEGIIESEGTDGEGTHRLLREGGSTKTAYLFSSVLDLDQFIGKKVQVWGETHKAQKAGWLMDVGRVKILE